MAFFVLGVAILVVVVAVAVYLYWPTWKVRHVPAAPYILGIGHIPLISKYQSAVFVKLAKEIGPIYRFQLGRQPLIFVTTPELCQEIGVKKFKSAPNRTVLPYMKESRIHIQGLFMTRGSRWSKMRNIELPNFHTNKLLNYVPLMQRIMVDVTEILSSKADTKEDVNMTALIQKMSLDIIGETAFGTEFGLIKDTKAKNGDSELVDAVLASLNTLLMDEGAPLSTFIGMTFPILQHPVREVMKRIPGTGDWTQHKGNMRLKKELTALLRRREAEKGVIRTDALSLLLNARKNDEETQKLLEDEYVLALCYELMLAGSESTSTSLAYVLYFVSCHPEVEQKLLQEIDRLAPSGCEISFEDIDKFTYLDQVIKEAMRILTFSPVVARETLEDIQLGGYHLPKGTMVWLAINVLALDATQFPEPESFRPERFHPDCEENKNRHPYSHSPFGIGPRMCIGYKYANLQMKLALIKFYRKFTFQHSPVMEKPLETRLGIVVRPVHGVKLRVYNRF